LSQANKIKFVIVGTGHIGKRHAEMIERNEEAELVALIDILPKEKLNLEKFNVPVFNSLEAFFSSGIESDVVNICTPNGYHSAMALKALENKKHVVIEKPMALSKAEAEKVIFKALHAQRQVFCVMQNRYSPPSVWLKDILDQGILGKIFMVQVNCFWNRDDRYYKPNAQSGRPSGWHGTKDLDGGTLFTQFSHFIDLMYWYFGDITNIHARLRDFKHEKTTDFEDSGFISFDFTEGGIGSINYSTAVWDKNLESSIMIVAENGSVKVGGQYMNEVEYCHIKDYTLPDLAPTNPGNDYGAYKGSAQNHNFVIENIVDVLNNRKSISVNALEGLKVVEIIERIYSTSK
jgi:UDP-N-acetyl-2-amino-2-deoxyglucuronate dehydrogenase